LIHYWYVFVAIIIMVLFGVLFLAALLPVISNMRFRERMVYKMGMMLITLGMIALIVIVFIEEFREALLG